MSSNRKQLIVNYLSDISEDPRKTEMEKLIVRMFMKYATGNQMKKTEKRGKEVRYPFFANLLETENEFKIQGFPSQITHVIQNLVSYLMVSVYLQIKMASSPEVFYMKKSGENVEIVPGSKLTEAKKQDKSRYVKVNKTHITSVNSSIMRGILDSFPKIVNGIAKRLYGSSKVFSDPQTYSKIYYHNKEFITQLFGSAVDLLPKKIYNNSGMMENYFQTVWLSGKVKKDQIVKVSPKFKSVCKSVEVIVEKNEFQQIAYSEFLQILGDDAKEYSRAEIESDMQRLTKRFCESEDIGKYAIYHELYKFINKHSPEKLRYLSMDVLDFVTFKEKKFSEAKKIKGGIEYLPLEEQLLTDALEALSRKDNDEEEFALASNKAITSAVGILALADPAIKDQNSFHSLPKGVEKVVFGQRMDQIVKKVIQDMKKDKGARKIKNISIVPSPEILKSEAFEREFKSQISEMKSKKELPFSKENGLKFLKELSKLKGSSAFSHSYQIVFNSLFKQKKEFSAAEFDAIQQENQFHASMFYLAKNLFEMEVKRKLKSKGVKMISTGSPSSPGAKNIDDISDGEEEEEEENEENEENEDREEEEEEDRDEENEEEEDRDEEEEEVEPPKKERGKKGKNSEKKSGKKGRRDEEEDEDEDEEEEEEVVEPPKKEKRGKSDREQPPASDRSKGSSKGGSSGPGTPNSNVSKPRGRNLKSNR